MIKLAVVSDNIDNRYHTKYDSDDTLSETKVGVSPALFKYVPVGYC